MTERFDSNDRSWELSFADVHSHSSFKLMRNTLKNILAEYGAIAVVVYLALFFIVFVGAYFGIRLGWAPGGAVGTAGAWTAAYIVTKITQPLRIAATVVLATFFGRLWQRGRPKQPNEDTI